MAGVFYYTSVLSALLSRSQNKQVTPNRKSAMAKKNIKVSPIVYIPSSGVALPSIANQNLEEPDQLSIVAL